MLQSVNKRTLLQQTVDFVLTQCLDGMFKVTPEPSRSLHQHLVERVGRCINRAIGTCLDIPFAIAGSGILDEPPRNSGTDDQTDPLIVHNGVVAEVNVPVVLQAYSSHTVA
uniref:Uncharacterized protein n=1 Tax=Eutreptiella gymnastica TaxID=73025 RepID=A0A6U8JKQ9_9EUGL